jgi:integrase
MRVQEVLLENNNRRYILVDEEGFPVIPVVKYLKYLDTTGKSRNTLKTYCYALKQYFVFLQEKKKDYRKIRLEDLVEFVAWLRNPYESTKVTPLQPAKAKRAEKTINLIITAVTNFYDYLYRNEELQNDMVDKLTKQVFTGGRTRYKDFLYHVNKNKPSNRHILKVKEPKVLTKEEVQQLIKATTNIRDRLLIQLLFETGLRISDVLGLKQDCLVKLNGKYYIEADIEKTYVQGHRIPIDDELASILAVLIDKSIKNSNDDNNPEKYIFVRYRGSRKGKPFLQEWVRTQLNTLAKAKNITDENGNLFYFKPHQIRHTYAVKMLNSGADILTVQELLAHASPEMTLRYAKLLDDTKRKAFEKVIKQGVFSFNLNGEVREVKPDEDIPSDILETLWRDHKLNAIDNPYGTCRARINGNCPYAEEPPCLTCNGGSPCKDLAIGFSDLDIQKYELLIKTTTKTIEVAEQHGRYDMVEKNKKNLERYEKILNTIKEGNIIFGRLERIKRKQGV